MAETTLGDLPPDLRRLHTKGVEAVQRSNFDYAITLFSQVLDKAPQCYECRAALRGAQQKKSGGSSGGLFKRLLSNTGSSPQITKGRMALGKNPLEALQIAEQVLNGDPQNSYAHKLLADAALAAQMPRTAVLSLEILHRISPDDNDVAVELAEALAESGSTERAESIMVKVCRDNPGDPALAEKMKNISAQNSMAETGFEQLAADGGSYRDVLRNKEEAVTLEQEGRVHKSEDMSTRLIGEYETRIQTEPDNLKLVRSLAELYTEKKQFDRALEYYDRLKKSDAGNDPSLDKAITNTKVRQLDQTIAEVNPFAADQEQQIAKLQADKLALQIEAAKTLVDRYPTELVYRYELGVLYFQAGKIGEAIAELQKAQASPNKRIAAMGYLAQCYARRKMFDLAARTLQNAIKEKAVLDNEKKELIYNLGVVLESMNKKEDAIEQFKILYEIDIGYRDVGARVDAYYAAQ